MANMYTEHDNIINVVAYPNAFGEKNSFYGKVARNTITVEQLIKGILSDNQTTSTGLNAFLLHFAMDRMAARILEELKAGNAVSLLGLGTMYLTVKGSFAMDPSTADVSALRGKSLSIGFSPAEDVQNIASKIKPGSITVCQSVPVVNSIVNLAIKQENVPLTAGKAVELKGNRLKIEGAGCGIYLVAVADDDTPEADENKWTSVPESDILRNYPRDLIFQLPASLAEGRYIIAVRTAFMKGGLLRKSPVTGYSAIVTVGA